MLEELIIIQQFLGYAHFCYQLHKTNGCKFGDISRTMSQISQWDSFSAQIKDRSEIRKRVTFIPRIEGIKEKINIKD